MSRKICIIIATLLVFFIFMTVACNKTEDKNEDPTGAGAQGSTEDPTDSTSTDTAGPTAEPTPRPLIPDTDFNYGGKTVRLGAWWDIDTGTRGKSERDDMVVDKFELMQEKYNFKFEMVNIPGSGTDMANSMAASIISNDPLADFFYLQAMFVMNMAGKGLLYSTDDIKALDSKDFTKWNKGIAEFATYKGKSYSITTQVVPRNELGFNKGLLDRLGLDTPYELQRTKQWNWDIFLNYLIKATVDPANGEYGLVGNHLVLPFVTSNGGSYVKFVEDKPVMSMGDPETLEALEFFQNLYTKHGVVFIEPEGNFGNYDSKIPFGEGKVAFMSSDAYVFHNLDMPDDYGVVAFPMGPRLSEYKSACGDYVFWCVPVNIEDPEEKGFIFSVYNDPLPTDTEDSWRDEALLGFRDEESLEALALLREGNLVINTALLFSDFAGPIFYGTEWDLTQGQKTPANIVEERLQQGQSILDDAYASFK